MKKKLTLWIVLLPWLLTAQQTEFKDGALVIDFGKKKQTEQDSTAQKEAPKKTKKTNVEEEQEEDPNFQRDGLFKGIFGLGLNLSQIDGDDQAGYAQPGAQASVGVMVKFHKNLSVSTEIQYSMKGAFKRRDVNQFPSETFRISWDYIQVPLLFNIHDKKLVMASLGLGVSYLARNRVMHQVSDSTGAMQDFEFGLKRIEPRRFDLTGIAGFQFLIKKVFGIGARFEYSFLRLAPAYGLNTKVRNMFNNTVTIRATYILNPVKKK